jgi:hypothetical protein
MEFSKRLCLEKTMTGLPTRPKRSESAQALILTICVISLAVSITLYAFLSATATSRENARLAASKTDISQREDLLMRSILHKFAEGIVVGQTWDTILNNALSEMRASTYINPTDLTALFPGQNVVPANLADSNAGVSRLIPGFTGAGFSGMIPYAGVTNISNVDSGNPAKSGTLPPLLQYGLLPGQEAADRLLGQDPVTIPQYMFFKSVYSIANALTPSLLSPSNRWGALTYPNIRFGLERPGDPFMARRIWWRIPVQFTSSFGGYTGSYKNGDQHGYTSSKPVNYIISVYDFPSQLPIKVGGSVNALIGQEATGESWGNTSTSTTGNVKIDGSVYGDSVQLSGSTFTGNISARTGVSVQQSATVGSETFSDNTYADLGVRETKDTSRSVVAGVPPVSAAGDGGKVLLTSLASSDAFFMRASGTPTLWDLYSRPYYRCPIRIIITNIDAAGNISLTVQALISAVAPLTSLQSLNVVMNPDALLGVADPVISGTLTAGVWNLVGGWKILPLTIGTAAPYLDLTGALQKTTTATGDPSGEMPLLEIDVSKLFNSLLTGLGLGVGPCAIYIGYKPANPISDNGNLAIALLGTSDLHLLFTNPLTGASGLSIVTKQRLYILGDFNQVKLTNPPDTDPTHDQYPPTSLYAPEIRFGVNPLQPTINLKGRIDVDHGSTSTATQINPLAATSGSNSQIAFSQRQYNLTRIYNPKMVPPITRLNLLFTIEKEYTQ